MSSSPAASSSSSSSAPTVLPTPAPSAMDAARRAASSTVSALFSEKSSIVVFAVIALVVILLVIAFIIYKVRRADLDSSMLVKDPLRLYNMTPQKRITSDKVPATTNGQEFAYSAWLYLANYTAPTSSNYLVFYRGGTTDSNVAGASPVVHMDRGTNKLYISLRTNLSSGLTTTPLDLLTASESKYLTATVDYVPMQRWVHVVFVVQDNLLTVYMDGQMYTVENVQDFFASSRAGSLTARPIFSPTAGDVMVGAFANEPMLDGYISRLQFFNYGLTADDVAALYAIGPVKRTLLSRLGIAEYGVRTPIYKIDTEEESKNTIGG
jgi:Concanavalin A-like lectin/glucanases superfamily